MSTVGTPTMSPPETMGEGNNAGAQATAPALSPGSGKTGTATSAGPALSPPAAQHTGSVKGVAGTWNSGVTIDALWSDNQTRNAFMHVTGANWVKIFNGSDGPFNALTTLASQARQTGSTINFRSEADGMVHEIYLW